MHSPALFFVGLVVFAAGVLFVVFRGPLARGFEKVWEASRSRPLLPTTPTFFVFGGLIFIGGGLVSIVRAFS
jgi:hypothetical protein